MTTVYNEKELELALMRKENRIVLEGPKASAIVRKFEEEEEKKRNRRNVGVGLALLFLVAAPFTGGASLFGFGATAAAVAISDTVLAAIISALAIVSAEAIRALRDYKIHKLDYNRVEFVRNH